MVVDGQAIQNNTEPLAKLCQMLGESITQDEGVKQTISIDEVLEVANSIAADFTDIYDYSAPCFPKSYGIFDFIMKCYHKGFGKMLDSIGEFARILSNRQILSVMTWITQFQQYLVSLGIAINANSEDWSFCTTPSKDEPPIASSLKKVDSSRKSILSLDAFLHAEAPAGRGEQSKSIKRNDANLKPGVFGHSTLAETYVERLKESLSSWFMNIVEAEEQKMAVPKEDDNGKLWKPALIDLFRILNQQVAVVQKATTGAMLLEASRAIIQVMIEFQDIERERLSESLNQGLTLESAIATVNTNLRAYDMSLELAESTEDALDDDCKGVVDIEEACRGFLQVAKVAVDFVALCIIGDDGIGEIVNTQLFGSDWCTGRVTEVLLATLEDYMQDVSRWIEKSFCSRVAESLLAKVIDAWLNTFVSTSPIVSMYVTEQMTRDCMEFQKFFTKYTNKASASSFQLMENFTDLVDSDSMDSFVISYRLLLELKPDFKPAMVEKILSAREDINKKDASFVLSQCEEIYLEKAGSTKGATMHSVSNAYKFLKYAKKSSGQD